MITFFFYFIFNAHGEKSRLHTDIEFAADGVCALDYQADADQNFLIKKDFRYYLTDQRNITLFQINIYDSTGGFLRSLELDGRPPRELLFQSRTRDTLRVRVYQGSEATAELLLTAVQDVTPPAGWDGGVVNIRNADLNGDGAADLIFTVAACFDQQPRGLIAYDFKNRRPLWHFWLGAFPRDVHLADVDQDGGVEIIFTTTAVSNGSNRNGFSDTLAYAVALRANGRVMWRRVMGGKYIDAISWLGDWDGDGTVELLVVPAEGAATDTGEKRIMLLDARNGETRRYVRRQGNILGAVVCDLDRDEKYELLTGSAGGEIQIYNRDLHLIQEKQMGTRVDLLGACDLDRDGSVEVILREPENRLAVMNDNLQLIDEYRSRTGKRISADFVHTPAAAKILVCAGESPPFDYTLLTLKKPLFLRTGANHINNVWFWITVVLVVAFLPIHIFVLRWHRNLKKRSVYANQLLEWSGLAQRLAHEIKNPLSTINLTLQRLQEVSRSKFGGQAQALDKYTASILEEVERLRDTTDKFMKIIAHDQPRLSQENINELLEEVLQRFEVSRPEGVRIEKHLTSDLPLINCDQNQIKSLFVNIIENAVEAMAGQGVLTLRSSLVERVTNRRIGRLVEIRIEDTGRGISAEGMQKIFRTVHTTKESGNGIGLLIAKRVVDSHNGHIDIMSREGVGTVVTIQLPVEEK